MKSSDQNVICPVLFAKACAPRTPTLMKAKLSLLLADAPDQPVENHGAVHAPAVRVAVEVKKHRRVLVTEVWVVTTSPAI